jgi:RNA polymerase sigma-70 factor (ECF subfamily)
MEPNDTENPDSVFAHTWANELLSGVTERLREAYEAAGRREIFNLLLPFLMWERDPPSHREIATQIGSSVAATRILIHRLRVKFRTLLREEIARTVMTPEEIPGELAWLQETLAAR